jgi:hypothetical protein
MQLWVIESISAPSVFFDGFEQDWLFGAHGGRVHQELLMHINERSRHPEQAPSARAQPNIQARVGRAQPGARCVSGCRRAGGRINSNLLFAWRRMHLSAQERPHAPAQSQPSPTLLPVTIEAAPVAA